MNLASWIASVSLSLLLIGGVALEVSAQQPAAPPAPAPAPSETTPAPTNPAPTNPTPPVPRTEYGGQPQQAPPSNSQIDTRPAPRAERETGTVLGVDPALAMVIGAVLVIVVVIALVAMNRRGDEVRGGDTPRRHQV
jgi:hypothetical protein